MKSRNRIAIEDLQVSNMMRQIRTWPGRSPNSNGGDSSSNWFTRLKAPVGQWCGSTPSTRARTAMPAGTGRTCHWVCASFACGGCGLVTDRDVNAARNILQRGIALAGWDIGPPWVVPARPRVFLNHMSPGLPGQDAERYAAD